MVHTNIAKREDPIEKGLGKLRNFESGGQEAVASIIEALELSSSPVKNQAITVCNDLRKIQNVEYQDLVANLNGARDERVPLIPALKKVLETGNPSLAFQRVLESIVEIHNFLKTPKLELDKLSMRPPPPFTEQGFVDETLRLVRMAYPFGINIVNARWSDDLPVSLDTSKKITLAPLSGGKFSKSDRVEITAEGSKNRLTFYDSSNTPQASCTIGEGQTATIGRRLQLDSLYEENVYVSSRMDLKVPSAAGSWSRGGILVVREGGDMYFFDRGCRNELVVAVSDRDLLTYNPTQIGRDGDRFTMGHTKFLK